MPRHISPTSQQRTAAAPYNFVPLPERVFTVAEGIEVDDKKIKPWEMHAQFVPGTHSGWIDLTIETLTPLYIRGATNRTRDGSWDDRDARVRPAPYTRPDGTPAIPGSSLRGMVRVVVEIISFSKIDPVTHAQPFFRTVADDRIGRAYRARMVRASQKPRGGILVIQDGSVRISPREVVRVGRSKLQGLVQIPERPNDTPPWPQQYGPCWVKLLDRSDSVDTICVGEHCPTGSGWRSGTLVLTGHVPNKKREFVFLDPEGSASEDVSVPEPIWDRFHDDDQVTDWQERAFPRNQPVGSGRKAAGHLRHGEPVFFLTDPARRSEENPAGLVFLGHAGMFRLPYDRSPADLIPEALRVASVDLTEAMFGKVGRDSTIRGRLRFEDAVATAGGPDWFEPPLVPQILSAPKPTTFQHYLTQDGRQETERLTTYLEADHTTIRGHKVYWHRWNEGDGISQVKEANDHAGLLRDLQGPRPRDTQHTIIRPVKAGVTFGGRVWFENLTAIEIGALLEALQLPEGCRHRLGMGKPLGLGSIRVASRLRLVDRSTRYGAWQATGVNEGEDGSRFRDLFVTAILQHAHASNETLLADRNDLRQVARLAALYQILEWSNRPARDRTAYMGLERFRQRPVLPTPHAVAASPEPPWPDDPPRPGPAPGVADIQGDSSGRMAHHPRTSTASTPVQTYKPVEKGQTRSGVLHRRGDTWVAVFAGDGRHASIANSSAIPPDCADDTAAEFYITEQSKRGGITARFERIEKK